MIQDILDRNSICCCTRAKLWAWSLFDIELKIKLTMIIIRLGVCSLFSIISLLKSSIEENKLLPIFTVEGSQLKKYIPSSHLSRMFAYFGREKNERRNFSADSLFAFFSSERFTHYIFWTCDNNQPLLSLHMNVNIELTEFLFLDIFSECN